MISIGTPSARVATGTIWLYSYSWYGLQKIQLAEIKQGVARVPVEIDRLKRELDPHPNTDGYVIALQIGEHLWYRTRDFSPQTFWSELLSAVNSLGRASAQATGETQLILPSPARRHITLRYPDGRPAVNADISASIFLWNMNHCGFHSGLPLGTFHTDKTGTFEVMSQLVPLYLDVPYYEDAGTGPAGVAYSNNFGLKTGSQENFVLKESWQLTDDDYLLDDYEVQVLTAAGQPHSGVDVWANWLTNTCGGADRIGQTDSGGIAKILLDPSFTRLELMIDGPYSAGDPKADENTRELMPDELRELFAKHKLTIRW